MAKKKFTPVAIPPCPWHKNHEMGYLQFFEDAAKRDEKGQRQKDRVRLIDFNKHKNNRFLAVSQLWVRGDLRFRRPDVLLYVNGIPLVFIELKNSNIKLKSAYDENITNYRAEIPQLFMTNAFCVLSNGIETKVGSC